MSPNSEGTSANAEGGDVLSDDLNELVLTPIPDLGITGNAAPGLFGGGACGCQSHHNNQAASIFFGLAGLIIYFKRKKNRRTHD